MLANDLVLGANLRKTITDLIRTGGGNVINDIETADAYVCQFRGGEDYVRASRDGKEVGNLAWIYHLITHNRWTSPTRRMLHYPIPRDGIPGFKDMLISVSNYSGDARVYLENLVKACGAEFTKTMRQDNTHLITAHMQSEKCDAAQDWNIHVINHLWLEESYAKYQIQSLTVKRYTHFPPRTNLGEVVGQTQLDLEVLEKHFYPRPKQAKQKASASTKPTTEAEPLQEVDNMDIDEPTPISNRKIKRNRTDPLTPALRKFVDPGKENETPGTTGSRGAKDRAVSKLHDAAADIALYNKEIKRVGGVTHGKDRRSSSEKPDAPGDKTTRGRKRQSNETDEDLSSEADAEPSEVNGRKGTKRSKSDKLPPITYRMVLTGYQRWVDDPKVESTERNALRNLGIHITEETANVQILCAPKIVRTKKFVCALAGAPEVVSTAFLDYCLKNKKVPDPAKYPLHDRDTEERLGIRLRDTLEQAEINNRHLLKGWQIFCTEQVVGGFDTFKAIVEANGGTCMLYRGRISMNVSKRSFNADDAAAESQGDDKGDTLYLISGSTKPEIALWDKFRQMAEAADMVPVIAKSDWLLSVAMRHEIHWDDKWELKEGS